MAQTPVDRTQAIAQGTSFGISPEVSAAVVDAYLHISQRNGVRYDPGTWSKTVWLAEADRLRRSPSPESHRDLVLHLEELRGRWENLATRGVRGWQPGATGVRLSRR